jgi:hypothetical protein
MSSTLGQVQLEALSSLTRHWELRVNVPIILGCEQSTGLYYIGEVTYQQYMGFTGYRFCYGLIMALLWAKISC